MAGVKWIKITTDIFDDEKILLIESLPDSDAIIVIWFKLLCLAGKQNNKGVFMMSNQIAYTDGMLATIFRRKESVVKMALQVFEQFGMIETIDGVITIPNWGKHQSMDKIEAKNEYMRSYMRDYRAKQRALTCKDNCKTNSKANVSEADKEEDKEKEIDKDKENIYEPSDAPFGATPASEYPVSEVAVAKESKKPKKEKPVKHKYGEYSNVLLTDEELDKLKTKFPDWESKIDNLSCYIESKGAKYKSHYATILNWSRRETVSKANTGYRSNIDVIHNRVSAVDDW